MQEHRGGFSLIPHTIKHLTLKTNAQDVRSHKHTHIRAQTSLREGEGALQGGREGGGSF